MKLAVIIGVIFMFLYNVITAFVLGIRGVITIFALQMYGALQLICLRTQEHWNKSERCWRAADVSFEEFKKEANRGKWE
jgi:type IV secretory pathway VirB3-like protein